MSLTLEAFIQWCKTSEYKIVRDWIDDKDSIKDWFWSSINKFFSEIPKEDWYLTPGDTNLNEGEIQIDGGTMHPLQPRQSKAKQNRKNAARRAANHRKALECNDARTELEEIDLALEQEAEARKTSNTLTKDLKAKKKEIQAATGVKKVKCQGEQERVHALD
ncbi:hypothetical protein C8R45DRAFT_936754 [Mycena sanguinolenta]|nr:hypothetical protein C8R45DRAFT_936754 [Mycena sanguinolenta]